MAQEPRRNRGPGTASGYPQANYTIPSECKQKLETVSKRMGMSASRGLEAIIEHLELDSNGLPRWFTGQEELPMQRAS